MDRIRELKAQASASMEALFQCRQCEAKRREIEKLEKKIVELKFKHDSEKSKLSDIYYRVYGNKYGGSFFGEPRKYRSH